MSIAFCLHYRRLVTFSYLNSHDYSQEGKSQNPEPHKDQPETKQQFTKLECREEISFNTRTSTGTKKTARPIMQKGWILRSQPVDNIQNIAVLLALIKDLTYMVYVAVQGNRQP